MPVMLGVGRFEKIAVTVALLVGMINKVVGDAALLVPVPVQPAKNFPFGALLAVSVRIDPAPKFPPPLPLLTMSE